MGTKIRLTYRTDSEKYFESEREEFFLGRLDECDFTIDDPYVSRRQAKIFHEDGAYRIENIGRNPVWINGQPAVSSALRNGDVVTAGETDLLVEIVESRQAREDHPGEERTVVLPSHTVKDLGPRLLVTSTSGQIQSFPLTKETTLIGRTPNAEIPLEDASVSRQHARIERRDQGYFVISLSGSNPVLVNHEMVRERRLYAGDELQIGRYLLSFISERSEDVRPVEKTLVVKTRKSAWMGLAVAAGCVLVLGGYVSYWQAYRPWRTGRELGSLAEQISSGEYRVTQERLKELLGGGLSERNARIARKLLAESSEALLQQMAFQGEWREAKSFLTAYLKEYGAGVEAKPLWDALDRVRIQLGRKLESAGSHQEAVRELVAVGESSPHFQEAQQAISRVWQTYQKQNLGQQVETQTVSQLLAQAEEHFRARRFLTPANQSAYAVYQAVLSSDPGNEIALQRIDQIKKFYRVQGNRYATDRKWEKALVYLQRYLLIDPDDPEINRMAARCRSELAAPKPVSRREEKKTTDKGTQQERIRRLLEDSGAESSKIMKYLFEDQEGEGPSESPW